MNLRGSKGRNTEDGEGKWKRINCVIIFSFLKINKLFKTEHAESQAHNYSRALSMA